MSEAPKIYEGFDNWNNVQNLFETNEAEPDEVYCAYYDTPPYEGFAFVAFRRGNKYFTAHGSHCSCYGLEGQWEPEQYENKEQFIKSLGLQKDPVIKAAIERIK